MYGLWILPRNLMCGRGLTLKVIDLPLECEFTPCLSMSALAVSFKSSLNTLLSFVWTVGEPVFSQIC